MGVQSNLVLLPVRFESRAVSTLHLGHRMIYFLCPGRYKTQICFAGEAADKWPPLFEAGFNAFAADNSPQEG